MPEQLLNRADVVSILEQVRGERMPECMAGRMFGQARPNDGPGRSSS